MKRKPIHITTRLVATLVLPTTLTAATPQATLKFPDAPFDMPAIRLPVFSRCNFDIRDYGARTNAETPNTDAIAKAIAACSEAGGGRVVVPAGVWLTGAIHLRNNVNLHLKRGAVLRFSTNPQDYLPPVFTRWAGFECYNYSPLIYARDCRNIAITGAGLLDGQGKVWWDWVKEQDRAARKLYDLVLAGIPVEKRVFGNTQDPLRPQFIAPIGCTNVLIEGISINSGPFWTVQAIYCENVVVRGLAITNSGPNNDGVNADSCRNVLIESCVFRTGDDCIALKSGLNEDGWRVGRATENVVIRRCRLLGGHGLSIGSDMSGGVRNVWVHDCQLDNLSIGLRFKSTRGRGGIVENFWADDVRISNIRHGAAISLNSFYKAWFGAETAATPAPPTFRDIHFRNITSGAGNRAAIEVIGLPEQPIEDVRFENVSVSANTGVLCTDARGITFRRCRITPQKGPVVTVKDSQDIRIEKLTGPPQAPVFLRVEGAKSAGIRLAGNQRGQKIEFASGASGQAVVRE